MPIRSLTVRACILGMMLSSTALARADASEWNGSYVADGTCFCVGAQSREIDSRIIPTPVGGQSINQICERVGKGPALQEVNGKFNFTVFPDAQCGNGPFADVMSDEDKQCFGHKGVSGEDCSAPGPKWDLVSAYDKNSVNGNTQLGITDSTSVTGGSRYIKPPVKQSTTTQTDVGSIQTESKPIAKIVRAPKAVTKGPSVSPKLVRIVVPETTEQIRARQLKHIAAARERARLKAAENESQSIAPKQPVAVKEPIDATLPPAEVVDAATDQRESKPAVETLKPITAIAKTDAKTNTAVPSSVDTSTSVSELKFPTFQRKSSKDFDYFEGTPVSYDFGGEGMSVAVSKSSHNLMQYFLSAAAVDSYREAAIGVGLFLTPTSAERLTLVMKAGVEYGMFSFHRDTLKANVSDTGAFVSLASRFAVTQKLKLQAGIGYSSFFEGDAIGFGAAFYHFTPNFDITAKAEAGDNDLLGFGIRYHY